MENIKIEETFYENEKPKTLRHIQDNEPTPILEKGWYENGQLQYERTYNNHILNVKTWDEEGNKFYESQSKEIEIQGVSRQQRIKSITFYPNGQIAKQSEEYGKEKYFDINGENITKPEYESSQFHIENTYELKNRQSDIFTLKNK